MKAQSKKTNVKILKDRKRGLEGKRDYLEGKLHKIQEKLDEVDVEIEVLEMGQPPSETSCKTIEDKDGNVGFMSVRKGFAW